MVINPNIGVGEWTIYIDFAADPVDFERNNVLYHYQVVGVARGTDPRRALLLIRGGKTEEPAICGK